MIDIGANLTHESFNKDRSEVIQAAVESGLASWGHERIAGSARG